MLCPNIILTIGGVFVGGIKEWPQVGQQLADKGTPLFCPKCKFKFATTTLQMKSSYDQLTKNTNHAVLKMTRYVL